LYLNHYALPRLSTLPFIASYRTGVLNFALQTPWSQKKFCTPIVPLGTTGGPLKSSKRGLNGYKTLILWSSWSSWPFPRSRTDMAKMQAFGFLIIWKNHCIFKNFHKNVWKLQKMTPKICPALLKWWLAEIFLPMVKINFQKWPSKKKVWPPLL
jgi:hypothetical protein